jgi:membrane associated rhomboid family serine protease
MRGGSPRGNTSAVIWLISALIAVFVLELILLSPWLGATGPSLVNQLTLTIGSLQRGHLWTLLTHSFLHSTTQPLDILFTVLMLYFIGRELEPQLGARRFFAVYLGAASWLELWRGRRSIGPKAVCISAREPDCWACSSCWPDWLPTWK